jgi:hypothetical protein
LQQIGGDSKQKVLALQQANAPLIPVSIDDGKKFWPLYEKGKVTKLDTPGLAEGWTNFYRSDDLSATAYFYLDRPENGLERLKTVGYRTTGVK